MSWGRERPSPKRARFAGPRPGPAEPAQLEGPRRHSHAVHQGRREENAIVKTHERRIARTLVGALAGLCLLGTSGCGGFFYALEASSATSKLETARSLGAEKYAPYEFYYAQEHLWKAMEEASSADYGDAIDFASAAEKYADKAITLSKQAHEGSGR